MWYFGVQSLLLVAILAKKVNSFPYRGVSPRSVPGRIRATEPETVKDYLYNFLLQQQQQQKQQQQQLNRLQYSVPEYEPIYQQGYISRRPQINPETLAAILPYLSQPEVGEYNYDYNSGSPSAYTDDEGTWYDDAEAADFAPSVDTRDKNNQEAALLQLFVDHLAGKYSLEDLETLERQAVLEDNTENQLQALMPRKKSAFPLLGARGLSARSIIGFPDRKGQKEEPFVIPASSVRKPVFTRSAPITSQKTSRTKISKSSSATSSSPASHEKPLPSSTSPSSSPSSGVNKGSNTVPRSSPLSHRPSTAAASTAAPSIMTTMEPSLKSAYDDFMAYLDQERYLRKTADEAKQQRHSQQKRFVSEPQSLTQQLASLKKNVT